MYNIFDKQEAIREIKKYLFVVAERVYPQIGRTTIDGNYDNETKSAVEKFQGIKGIAQTGAVDLITFTALYNEYRDAVDDFYMKDHIVESYGFPVVVGDIREDVRALHILINELAKTYTEIENVGTGNYYSKTTAKAIQTLRRIFMLPASDSVDKKMYARMLIELDARRRADENPEKVT